MNNLFTNTILIGTSATPIFNILSNPENLRYWVSEISHIDKKHHQFYIYRNESALNPTEKIEVKTTDDSIIYQSTEGRLEYELFFKLTEQNNKTLVEETLIINSTNHNLPLTLLAPVAKHAFFEHLINLQNLVSNAI